MTKLQRWRRNQWLPGARDRKMGVREGNGHEYKGVAQGITEVMEQLSFFFSSVILRVVVVPQIYM